MFARKRSGQLHSRRRADLQLVLATTIGATAFGTGCGVSFDSVSQLDGVRVITVQKSSPYARPGDTVDLRMLYNDEDAAERDTQILWLRGCRNPPADLVQLCFEVFSEVLRQAEDIPPPPEGEPTQEELEALIESLQDVFDPDALLEASGVEPEGVEGGQAIPGFGTFDFGFGETFSLTLDDDIISSHAPNADPKLPPYGIEYVFFATCAGQLWLDPDAEGFPIGCFDEEGVRVRPDRYVVGYTTIWVYNEIENTNPRILGVEVRGERLGDDELCLNEACNTLTGEEEPPDCPSDRTVEPCEDEDTPGSCPALPLRVLVDEDSVETDGVLSSLQDEPVTEQMWVNYYADKGAFKFDVALVNDTQSGFNDDPATEFLAPEETGVSRVWAVVHDNRGGVEWARFDVCVED